jgi:hypothetical protein
MSALSPYRKLVGTLIGGVVTGLTWVIATGADPADWQTWAQFSLFILPALATYLSPANVAAAPAAEAVFTPAQVQAMIDAELAKAAVRLKAAAGPPAVAPPPVVDPPVVAP